MTEQTSTKRAGGRLPGFKGTSNRTIDYRCSACSKTFSKDTLRIKIAIYKMMGAGGKIIRSRTIQWLCVPCMHNDADFNREPFLDSPGLKDVRDGQA